jgi:hypothetical protein
MDWKTESNGQNSVTLGLTLARAIGDALAM